MSASSLAEIVIDEPTSRETAVEQPETNDSNPDVPRLGSDSRAIVDDSTAIISGQLHCALVVVALLRDVLVRNGGYLTEPDQRALRAATLLLQEHGWEGFSGR